MDEIRLNEYIHLCRQGDTAAFRFIVAGYQQMVYTLAFRLLCNSHDAEDMTQEVFIKAWQKLGSYNPRYKFSTWLYKITCNGCYDKLRSQHHQKRVTIAGLDIPDDTNMEDSIHNRELRELILHLTNHLSPKQKLVFTLSDIEELEIAEIGTITGMTPAKIKSNLYLARKQIKSNFSKDEL